MENGKVIVMHPEDSVEGMSRRQMAMVLEATQDFRNGDIGSKEMDLLLKASGLIAKHMTNIINSKKPGTK